MAYKDPGAFVIKRLSAVFILLSFYRSAFSRFASPLSCKSFAPPTDFSDFFKKYGQPSPSEFVIISQADREQYPFLRCLQLRLQGMIVIFYHQKHLFRLSSLLFLITEYNPIAILLNRCTQ